MRRIDEVQPNMKKSVRRFAFRSPHPSALPPPSPKEKATAQARQGNWARFFRFLKKIQIPQKNFALPLAYRAVLCYNG
jgi:hypothetical protein